MCFSGVSRAFTKSFMTVGGQFKWPWIPCIGFWVKKDWDAYLAELQQHSTMKGKRRSPRLHSGVTNGNLNGQKSIHKQQKYITSLALTEKELSKKTKMISICLNLCVAMSTFNYTPASLIFIQFSLWSFILLTIDPLWLIMNWGVLIVIWPKFAALLSG